MEVSKATAFLAVAEELHFGRAAQRLHMAQPPLSRLIRALEDELGAALFDRSPRSVALTAVGAALVEPARELVMQSERITQLARRVQRGETGRIRLGFAGASVNTVVSALTHRLRRTQPGLVLELSGSQLSEPGMERLRSGALDAVVGRWDVLPRDIDSHVVAHEELLVALPADHPLAATAALSASDVADQPWIVLPGGRGATLSARLQRLAMNGRFVPRIVETAADSATQLLLVDAGAGIALTFSGVRENIPVHSVVFRPLAASLGPVDVRLAWRRADMSPALERLIEVARSFPLH
ncbi:LysR family transcriptional regulator [Microbacterium protaetiae]|uniref:LysR family transcriptional regulator n=1 Tax=Microbacterium protaetiae TaxID=2509458 RepID=A0A4P6ENS7_9MICO|nr:LysR substrate-binding domain-containing protein [Microbacterium protaetiae]QAY59558.1 LysR family transcriptional regulator [Microbacterium protaetiae]